jgi:hypothetical protein
MRRLALAALVLLAGCAARPQTPVAGTPSPQPVQQQEPRRLLGLTPSELIGEFGTPALQIREGSSLKLQFRSRACVLDAYLYPPAGAAAPLRVNHVDTRAPSGSDMDQATCILAFENPS